MAKIPTTKSVTLASGTKITMHISANWLDMNAAEREYVFGLVDRLNAAPGAVPQEAHEEEVEDE